MGTLLMAFGLAANGLITVYLGKRVWAGRRKISCMTGMMTAMTAGMLTGLLAGVMAAAMIPGPLWPSTVAAMTVGMAVGILIGAPVSLMAILDGALAGLMGGMMGAMLGMMAPQAISAITLSLTGAYLGGSWLLTAILGQEGVPAGLPSRRYAILIVLAALIFIAAFMFTSADEALADIPDPAVHDGGHSMTGP